jgi:hypothetical protein
LSCLRRGMSLGSLSERSGGGLGIWLSERGSADGIVRCIVDCGVKKGHEWSWFNCRSSGLATRPHGDAVPLCGGADHFHSPPSRITALDDRLAPSFSTLKRAVRRYLSHTFATSLQRPPAIFPPRPPRTARETSSSGPASLIIRKTFIYNQNNSHDCMP